MCYHSFEIAGQFSAVLLELKQKFKSKLKQEDEYPILVRLLILRY